MLDRESLSRQLSPRHLQGKHAPKLLFRRAGREQFTLPLPRHRFRVGRSPSCDLRLPDPERSISREHFVLSLRAGELIVRDCSTNGTFYNETALNGSSRALRNGDRLRAGNWEMVVQTRSRPDDQQPAPEWKDSTRRLKLPSTSTQLQAPAAPSGRGRMLGESPNMHRLYKHIERIASYDFPVLLHGESGSGKELVAEALHACSPRATGPMVSLNCAAIPSTLASSTLFGHEKGSFTGAAQRHAGVFEQSSGGTLFLDEIAELSSDLQAALLRVLETQKVRPVGARTELPVSLRVICATHRDLREEVRSGRFREDLFFRISVTEINHPPLRDRGDDILLLARHFLQQHAPAAPPLLSIPAEQALRGHSWKGNVRELRNTMLRALVLCEARAILPEHLCLQATYPSQETNLSPIKNLHSGASLSGPNQQQLPPARLDEATQKAALLHALHHCEGNRSKAAAMLGISRSTLYARIKRLY